MTKKIYLLEIEYEDEKELWAYWNKKERDQEYNAEKDPEYGIFRKYDGEITLVKEFLGKEM